ncbi:hypothetical protein X943_001870, partial [Babesia divergens]
MSHIKAGRKYHNALVYIGIASLQEHRSYGNKQCSRFSTYNESDDPDGNQSSIDEVIPDLGGIDIADYDIDDPSYPIQSMDFNRKRNWEYTLAHFKKRIEEINRSSSTNRLHSGIDNYAHDSSETIELERRRGETPLNDQQHGETACIATKSDIDSITTPVLNQEQLQQRNACLSAYIESCLRERLNPKCSVGFFGSAINGLWTDASDLDLCVQIPNVTSRSAIIRNLRRIAVVLQPLAPERVFENRFTAKIPILHWKKGKSNKKPGERIIDALGCSIDISVNNVLAISNSALIGTYVACDPRVRGMVLALKLWARSRDLNDRSKGTFGSFALSLMVIHFLQRCSPPVLISLQDLAIAKNETPKYVSGIDVRFTTNMEDIRQELKWLTKGAENTMSTLKLIQEFFYYFGWTYTKNIHLPIAIRSVDFQFMQDNTTFVTHAKTFDL